MTAKLPRYSVSDFDAQTVQVLDAKYHQEVALCTAFDGERDRHNRRGHLVAAALNLADRAPRVGADLASADAILSELLSADLVEGETRTRVRNALELVRRSHRWFR